MSQDDRRNFEKVCLFSLNSFIKILLIFNIKGKTFPMNLWSISFSTVLKSFFTRKINAYSNENFLPNPQSVESLWKISYNTEC